MVCQIYNLSNLHIEGYTPHGYDAMVGWLVMCHLHFGGASDTLKIKTANSCEMLA
jgi:hypothetical protein